MAPGDQVPAGATVKEGYFRCGVCGKIIIAEEETVLPNCPVCQNDTWEEISEDD